MATKRQTTAVPDLKAQAVAVLLGSWGSKPPPNVDAGPHGFGSGMLECFRPDGPARLWRLHEPYLRQIAATWNWTPHHVGPDGVRRFYAEACVWESDHGEQHPHGLLALHRDDRDDEDV